MIKSERQERVLELLRKRGSIGATTKEIEDLAVVAAARDHVRRLRDAGYRITTIEDGRSKTGARIVRYRLESTQLAQNDLFPSQVSL